MYKKVLMLLLSLPFQFLSAQTNMLDSFPEGYTPEEVGKLIAYRFVYAKHALHGGKWISYPETFYWNGTLRFAELTNDNTLIKFMENRFEPLFTTEKSCCPLRTTST